MLLTQPKNEKVLLLHKGFNFPITLSNKTKKKVQEIKLHSFHSIHSVLKEIK